VERKVSGKQMFGLAGMHFALIMFRARLRVRGVFVRFTASSGHLLG